jgi:hypothetical protein
MDPSGFVAWLGLSCNRSISFGAISNPTGSAKAGQSLPWKGSGRVVAIRRDAPVLHERSVLR